MLRGLLLGTPSLLFDMAFGTRVQVYKITVDTSPYVSQVKKCVPLFSWVSIAVLVGECCEVKGMALAISYPRVAHS